MAKIDISELERLVDKLQDKSLLLRASSNSLSNATESLASYATKNAGFKNPTGATVNATQTAVRKLKSSIFVDSRDIPYIEPLYNGWNRTQRMFPVNKKALSFVIGGTRVFAKSVAPAKYKGNPFIFRAWKKRQKVFANQFAEDLTDQIEDFI
jgi:hypothetical protein